MAVFEAMENVGHNKYYEISFTNMRDGNNWYPTDNWHPMDYGKDL